MTPVADPTQTAIGTATARIDGRAKVTGEARYGSDSGSRSDAHAGLRTSAIARGRIVHIDESAARALPGVLEILTFRNVGDAIKPGNTFSAKGYMGSSIAPLAGPDVLHAGQIVALVVAESVEIARDAAQRLEITYAQEVPSATFDSPGLSEGLTHPRPADAPDPNPRVGDAAGAFAAAAVTIDQRYATPPQHHNPIELFTTRCAWDGEKLTVWEPSQNMYGFKYGLADQLGISPDNVHILSPFVGGAFGSRGSLTQRTAIVALAAKKVGRPVRLEASRADGFTIATYRAETRHRVRLGASRDGRLQALIHEGWEISSRPDDYKVAGTDATTRLYACANIDSNVTIVHADRNTPGFMRAPAELPYLFALESAMDELAWALRIDPVELRRINDTQIEPIKGLPYTSRALMPCFDAAAAAFGWRGRSAEPGSMRDGDWLIGWGCASTMYPTQMAPAAARVTLAPDGSAKVETATHEIGTGVMTVLALVVSQGLGVPVDRIEVRVGDSSLPPSPVAGGSNSTASLSNVVAEACADIAGQIAAAAVAPGSGGPFAGANQTALQLADGQLRDRSGRSEPLATAAARVSHAPIVAYAENVPHGVPPEGAAALYRGQAPLAGGARMKDRVQFAFGAQFVEVRVHAMTREVRAPRLVGAFAAGRIVNPKTAKSQLMGAQIWGISSALLEATEIDRRTARYYNDDLAEYLIPVNADIGTIETIILPETDTLVSPLGIKGIGELGNVGLNAAIANALFHATGMRIRELPVRMEKLLPA
jgi:xanthine dehydrogenase YagR molybdenum-binding subunit